MKTDQTFEKQLINFDEFQFRGCVGDFERNRDILNQIAELYEGLFSGKITRERIDQIMTGNFSALKEVAILEITKSVKNQMLAEVAIQRVEDRLFDFEAEATRLVYRFNQTGLRSVNSTVTPPDWFAINSDGRFYIPDETLSKIKENWCNYITSPEEQKIFDLLQKLGDMINEVHLSLGENIRQHLNNKYQPRHFNICGFLATDEKGNSIPDPQNDYKQLTR